MPRELRHGTTEIRFGRLSDKEVTSLNLPRGRLGKCTRRKAPTRSSGGGLLASVTAGLLFDVLVDLQFFASYLFIVRLDIGNFFLP